MNVGPMGGLIGSAAGAPLSQTSGSETERSQRDSSAQQRQVSTEDSAEKAAGIGTTDEDQGTSERDADGRRFWEKAAEQKQAETDEENAALKERQSKDPKGISGSSLDLTG
ncbi:hypothetical protein [Bythopirellula goksoeyrii]|uniref:Uncharacterized protein n=1 Tax=Bythopirellula goksoeyrii TaxID=1400387 RepID=A0A5B9QBS3_9BACT|nr:hypothetical protein [Bythopirellula goksoeyrii]QEG35030.1 hypothetical protein Pr1d_23200 [Bythopirellula goksoeyrii]